MSLKRRFLQHRTAAVTGATVTALLGVVFLLFPIGRALEHLSYDLPLTIRPRVSVDEVILVPLDELSHSKLRQPDQQAWDRALHARVISNLTRWNARAIALDIEFDDNRTNAPADRALAEAIRFAGGRVVLGASWGEKGRYLRSASEMKLKLPDAEFLIGDTNWGRVDFKPDSDGAVREHYDGTTEDVPSLSWRLATMVGAPVVREPGAFGRRRWVNYYGAAGALPQQPFYRVHEGSDADLPTLFAGKVVFVGAGIRPGFTGSEKEGFRNPQTWFDENLSPGMEVHATMFLNLLRHDWLKRPAPLVELGSILLAGTLLGVGLPLLRPLRAAGTALGVALLAFALGYLLVLAHTWFAWAVVALVQVPVALVCAIAFRAQAVEATERRGETTEFAAAPATAAVAPRVPDHELLRCIGSGSYGDVWLARNATGQLRAVKVVHRRALGTDKQFEREFEGLVRFEPISRRHEGLVQVLHVGRNDAEGYFYYVMELADDASGSEEAGERESETTTETTPPLPRSLTPTSYTPRTLRRDTRPAARLPTDECLRIGLALADALEFLHAQRLVHRDIKPSNIIFVEGRPKLADIGLVAAVDEARSFVGTEGYIPPEGPGTAQADIFSLGMVLYEIFTGNDTRQFPQLPSPPESPLATEFCSIVRRASDPDVRGRYPTAAAMQADLLRLSTGLPAGQTRL